MSGTPKQRKTPSQAAQSSPLTQPRTQGSPQSSQQASQQASQSPSESNQSTLLITAADSLAGAAVINHLAQLGGARVFKRIILALDLDAEINTMADVTKLSNVEVMKLNMKEPNAEKLKQVFQGVDFVALIPPANDAKFAASRALLAAADQARVKAVTLLSWTGTHALDDGQGKFPMLESIQQLEQEFKSKFSGIQAKVVVRANFYAQNLVTYAKQIVQERYLPIPTGSGKFAPLDVQTLGKAIASILVHPDTNKFAEQVFTFTGPEAVDADGIAKALSQAMGKDVTVKHIDMDEARQLLSAAELSLPKSEIDTILEIYTLVKHNRMDQISHDLKNELDIQHPSLVEVLKRDAPILMKAAGQ